MSYKSRLLIPTLAANALLIAYLVLAWAPEYAAEPAETNTWLLQPLLLWLVASSAISWSGLAYFGHRLRSLARQAQAIGQGDAPLEPPDGGDKDDFDRCAAQLRSLHVLIRQRQAALERESNLLRQCEQNLRESEERYLIAIRNANDGVIEWDLVENRILYSPRWKGMLGLDGQELGDHVDAWYSRIHQDDYERTRNAVQMLLEGKTSLFDSEHRLRQGNGDYIWVAARGVVIRSATGKPVKFICALTDITEKKLVQQLLSEVEQGLDTVAGEEFFRMLVKNMARALDAKYSFITECLDGPGGKPDRVRTIAFWAEAGFAENIEYDLAGTPCQEVIEEGTACFYPLGLARRFPKEAGMESYIGIPVLGENGRVVGHLACLDSAPMRNSLPIQAVQKLFAMRASAEIIRMSLQKSLYVAQRVNRVLCDHMDELVLLANAVGGLEAVNGPAMKLSGLVAADLPGYPITQVIAPPVAAQERADLLATLLADAIKIRTRRYCLLDKRGGVHEIAGVAIPIVDDHQRLEKIVLIARPVERK